MLKSHLKFHSSDGKRRILVVDDEMINREMLGAILSEQYEILYAEDGEQALSLIHDQQDTLSLVLLDVLMPRMDGLQLLATLREEHILDKLPVIVLTSDSSLEVKSLSYGATDFIPKPYPQADVIMARVLRTIELNEDRDIIRSTERDTLTGLYNLDYFYRYAEQYDQYHKQRPMDAIVLDINHFHMLNERNGKPYCDRVLQNIAQRLVELVRPDEGIVCRKGGDTFMIYCPNGQNYRDLLDQASINMPDAHSEQNRVRLRMGVYSNADKSIDIARRFDRAKNAADTVRNSYANNIAFYDDRLHERDLFREQLIDDFNDAIRQEQFQVYYQPKFDIRPDVPVLASAEALVRWVHPTLGFINPGEFIPLFEENGLIKQLDAFVWRKAASQIREWKQRYKITVPVSLNVSRIDMYDPDLITGFQQILSDYSLSPRDIILEITESAYTRDSAQIISTVNRLRELGLRIEMDDFGTGYSSLSMLSTLPIDALKLDMLFIRNAFSQQRDTRLIETIIDIASFLRVPVIAEGVETEDQVLTLKDMGCEFVQGYYFSRPLPAFDFERFLAERQESMAANRAAASAARPDGTGSDQSQILSIVQALSTDYVTIDYVDPVTGHYSEYLDAGAGFSLAASGDNYNADILALISTQVAPEDRDLMAATLSRDSLISLMNSAQPASVPYHLVTDTAGCGHRMRIMPVTNAAGGAVIIGIQNTDSRTK